MKSLRATASGFLFNSRFDEETRSFLQGRLQLMSGLLAVLVWSLTVLFLTANAWSQDLGPLEALYRYVTRFPNLIVFWLGVALAVVYAVTRRDRLSSGVLALLDGLMLQLLFLPCLILYALLHNFSFSGFAFVVPFLILFMLARAILVPSTPLRTFVLCVPAPLGVLAIQLWYGASYSAAGTPYRWTHFLDTLIQNQICLLGALALAVVATRVNLSLRRRTFDARRVGQYDVVREIGAGAMGVVYLATHSLLKRPTALKLLRADIAGAESLRRFEQEVRPASRLTHPNTIAIYDYGYTADGVFFYAMELLEGASLRDLVMREGPLPAGRVIHLLEQACAALREAHDKGILHRDVKAGNIMVCERGGEYDRVKIVDFGLAHQLGPPAR